MSLRSAAAATLLAVLTLIPCLNICSGWMHSAGERMACCIHSGGTQTQATADACCAHGERQNSEQMVSVGIAPPAVQPFAISQAALVPVARPSSFDLDIRGPFADSERHVFLSVFLI